MMNSAVIVSKGKVGFAQKPIPVPTMNQVLVKVESAALNPSDILFMKGLYKIKLDFPYTPGWEGAGTVVKCGNPKYNDMLINKRVAFMKVSELNEYKVGGAFADYAVADLRGIIPIHDEISFDHAASSVVNPLTAICMVDRLVELKSKACIVTAAASQLGRMLVKLCMKEGITPICTVRKEN